MILQSVKRDKGNDEFQGERENYPTRKPQLKHKTS